MKSSENEGVKGMLPLGSLPLWGNEGVTLQSVADKKRMTEKQVFTRAVFSVESYFRISLSIIRFL